MEEYITRNQGNRQTTLSSSQPLNRKVENRTLGLPCSLFPSKNRIENKHFYASTTRLENWMCCWVPDWVGLGTTQEICVFLLWVHLVPECQYIPTLWCTFQFMPLIVPINPALRPLIYGNLSVVDLSLFFCSYECKSQSKLALMCHSKSSKNKFSSYLGIVLFLLLDMDQYQICIRYVSLDEFEVSI